MRTIDRGFSRIKSDFNNVNLPAYTLAPAVPLFHHTDRIKPQITALQADSSHFSGVTLKWYQRSHFKPKISLKAHDNHTNISK